MCHLINSRPYRSPDLSQHGAGSSRFIQKGKSGFTHIFIEVDKITKWIEVKLATSIVVAKVVEFIKEIMYQFGVPNNIITDNGIQFTAREFQDFCVDSGIKINHALVSHLQSNSQVEHSNGMIL
jgi:transposase InsO family protein